MSSLVFRFLLLPLILLCSLPAFGEIIDSASTGFTVRHSVTITGVAPDEVYRYFVEDYGKWWEDNHSFSGDASNFHIDARPGGCLCEDLPEGGGVKHLEVAFAAPGKMIRFRGGLGPLQAMAVNGALTWEFKPSDAGTTVEMVYTVGGYLPGGLQQMASPVDYVLGVQIQNLKAYAEGKK